MEMNFLLMVVAALAGLVVNAIWKFNLWAILGSVSFLLLVFPILGLGFQHDPQVAQAMANTITERLISSLPSLIIGELAGSAAAAVFNAVAGVFR